MLANKTKDLMENGGNAIGTFCALGCTVSAEVMANAGFDFLFLDMQHGNLNDQSIVNIIAAVSTTDTTPIVRVPTNDLGFINRALDMGAMAIVCPLVNSRVEAENLVKAVKYPPIGGRSWGPFRASIGKPTYTPEANDRIMAIAMIETRQAYDNLDDILSTPNLDAVLVGPNDLSFSFTGTPKSMPDDPEAVAAIKIIAEKAAKSGLKAGIHCADAAMAKEMFSWGYHFASVGVDFVYMANAAKAEIEAIKS